MSESTSIICSTILLKSLLFTDTTPSFPKLSSSSNQHFSPTILWSSNNLIVFTLSIPNNSTSSHSLHFVCPQCPWDIMTVPLPYSPFSPSLLYWSDEGKRTMYLVLSSGQVVCGDMEDGMANSWNWQELEVFYPKHILIFHVLTLLENNSRPILLAVATDGTVYVSKYIKSYMTSAFQSTLSSLSLMIYYLPPKPSELLRSSGWETLNTELTINPLDVALTLVTNNSINNYNINNGSTNNSSACEVRMVVLSEHNIIHLYSLMIDLIPRKDKKLTLCRLRSYTLSIPVGSLAFKLFLPDLNDISILITCSCGSNALETATWNINFMPSIEISATTENLSPYLFHKVDINISEFINRFKIERQIILLPATIGITSEDRLAILTPNGDFFCISCQNGKILDHVSMSIDNAKHEDTLINPPGTKYARMESSTASLLPVLAISPHKCVAVILNTSKLELHLIHLKTYTEDSSYFKALWNCLTSRESHWDIVLSLACSIHLETIFTRLETEFSIQSQQYQEVMRTRFLSIKFSLLSTMPTGSLHTLSIFNHIKLLYIAQCFRNLLCPPSTDTNSWPAQQLKIAISNSRDANLKGILDSLDQKEFTCTKISQLKNHVQFVVDQAILFLSLALTVSPMLVDISVWPELCELIVLVAIWSKLYPRMAPEFPKTDGTSVMQVLSDLFRLLFHANQACVQNTAFNFEDIFWNVNILRNESFVFTVSDAPPLQSLLCSIADYSFPQIYFQGRSPAIPSSIIPHLNILDPFSLLLLETPRELSPPWQTKIFSSQYDLLNFVILTDREWQEGVKMCLHCRRFTQRGVGVSPSYGQIHSSIGLSGSGMEDTSSIKQTWCLCGGPWRLVNNEVLDIHQLEF